MNLSDLLPDILGRVEENVETGAPIFWNLTGEVYPEMVWGMFEAAMVTGVVQLSSQRVTLAANTTYFNMQGGSLVPRGCLAPLRMMAPYQIRKTSLRALDTMKPSWQQYAPGTQIRAWFPLGVSMFGIWPQFEVDSDVVMDFIVSPVNKYRPYSGNETIPFQSEFSDAFSMYGAALLRSKEGGAEAQEAETVYQAYMSRIKALSLFQGRLDSLVYSAAYGGQTMVNDRKAV